MAYDYSSENKRLELPNPYRLENFFLFACAAMLVAAGLTTLVWARTALQQAGVAQGAIPLVVGMGLLASALGFATAGARRLRFFFGRGRPASLAPEVAMGATGNSKQAETFKTMLRQGGLEYPEPQGALNGVLYHALPQLITAPLVVQRLAQKHFYNALAFLVTFLSFVCAWAFFGTPEAQPLISVGYFIFGAVMLVKPLVSGSQARVSTWSLVVLAAVAVVGPVLAATLGQKLPLLGISLHGQTFFMLGAALLAIALILLAVLAQMDAPPATERSCEQLTLSMNGPPSALITELDRRLQDRWTEQIPNRRYTRLEPDIQSARGSGKFAGELFEETQPMPMASTQATTLGSAMGAARHRWLVLIDGYSSLLVAAAVAFALVYVQAITTGPGAITGIAQHSWIGYSLICMVIAIFGFQSASAIWGRFNFESDLVWVELNGEWQASRIGTGNQLNSQLQTQNEVARVESMTLRVWRARVESVVFGKDSVRQVTAMFSTTQEARELAQALAAFADQQSVFIAPKAQADSQRLQFLQSTEAMLTPGTAAADPRLPHSPVPQAPPVAAPAADAPASSKLARYCTECGAALPTAAKFCSECGEAVEGA